MPPELLERYFEPAGDRYAFRKDLRRSVIFGRNDLVQDAPISRVDLLVCRNTLMYFNAETQARILGRFHFALADSGVLFLGKAEMLLSHGSLFTPDRPQAPGLPQGAAADAGAGRRSSPSRAPPRRGRVIGLDELRDEAFAGQPAGAARADPDGLVALTNRQAGDAVRGLVARHRPAVPRPRGLVPPGGAAPVHRAGPGRAAHAAGHRRRVRPRRAARSSHLEVQISPLTDGDAQPARRQR